MIQEIMSETSLSSFVYWLKNGLHDEKHNGFLNPSFLFSASGSLYQIYDFFYSLSKI